MDVIPVLDVRGGRALHARRGQRAEYAAVDGVLGRGDDPLALARAFRDRLGLRAVYLADLDAIAGTAEPTSLVAALADLGLEPWVDAGIRSLSAAQGLAGGGARRVLLALETLPCLDLLRDAVSDLGAARTAFSLDLRAGRPLATDPSLASMDPLEIALQAAAAGADTMVVIDLAAVGARAGVDLALLTRVRAALPHVRLIAGGGIRDVIDLERLAGLGCDGALVATALHDGRIGRSEIERVAGGAPPSARSAP